MKFTHQLQLDTGKGVLVLLKLSIGKGYIGGLLKYCAVKHGLAEMCGLYDCA